MDTLLCQLSYNYRILSQEHKYNHILWYHSNIKHNNSDCHDGIILIAVHIKLNDTRVFRTLFTYHFTKTHSVDYSWLSLLRLPNAWEPTLVGTNLLLPIPPERLRKSARRWVTHVAVLQALFCVVTLEEENIGNLNFHLEEMNKHIKIKKLKCAIFMY